MYIVCVTIARQNLLSELRPLNMFGQNILIKNWAFCVQKKGRYCAKHYQFLVKDQCPLNNQDHSPVTVILNVFSIIFWGKKMLICGEIYYNKSNVNKIHYWEYMLITNKYKSPKINVLWIIQITHQWLKYWMLYNLY